MATMSCGAFPLDPMRAPAWLLGERAHIAARASTRGHVAGPGLQQRQPRRPCVLPLSYLPLQRDGVHERLALSDARHTHSAHLKQLKQQAPTASCSRHIVCFTLQDPRTT